MLEGNSIFRNIYCWLGGNPGNAAACSSRDGLLPGGWEWLGFLVAGLAIILIFVSFILTGVMVITWMERRVIGRFQVRLGPNRAGPFGLLQPVADTIKIITKEDIVPEKADRWVFNAAPVLVFIPSLALFAVIPLGKNTFLADLNIGVLFILAITALGTMGIFMAGWSSNNKYALFGAMRAVAQLISYEVPMVLSIVGILLFTGSLSLVSIVEGQRLPFIILQPLAFLIFIIAATAELNRAPFDLVEAESELGAGYYTEYSGAKFVVFWMAEYTALLGSAALISVLFLDGWRGFSFLPSHLWFVLKVFLVVFIFQWIRATLPRLRMDQVMAFAWKFLFPLALINLFVVAIEVNVWPEPSTGQLWLIVLINSVLAVALVAVFSRVMRAQGVIGVPEELPVSITASTSMRLD